MLIKIALIAALIIFISRKFLHNSIQPKTKIKGKNDDVVDVEYTVVNDNESKNW